MRATDSGMVRQQRPSLWDEAGRRATEAGGARLRVLKNSSLRFCIKATAPTQHKSRKEDSSNGLIVNPIRV